MLQDGQKYEAHSFIAVAIIQWCCIRAEDINLEPSVKAIDSTAGLYFDEMGQIFFCPTQWKVVSYVDLKPTQVLWKQGKAHQLQISDYCVKIQNAARYPLTDCHAFVTYIRSKVRCVDRLRDIIADYLSTSERTKRGILDLEGNILKFLFGTLTQSDVKKYTEHIQRLENEQQSFLRVSQEQMTVLKSAIMSFNITMQKVKKNERF